MRTIYEEHHQFFTATILKWQNLLLPNENKEIIISSLNFLSESKRVKIYGFVIMPNHIHLIWQVIPPHRMENVQRDFLKLTAQQLLKWLRNKTNNEISAFEVSLKDRKHQIWQRNALGIDLWSEKVFDQKLDYIHLNPCRPKWALAKDPEDYFYSSASYYEKKVLRFTFGS